ncbi:MAG: hypothetical protein R3C49_00345 [Planctomycetaceae bacterium]
MPYTADVWRKLLSPLLPLWLKVPDRSLTETNQFPLRFEHIQDDRIPLMSYIAVGDPADELLDVDPSADDADPGAEQKIVKGIRRISQADWMRLAFVDDEGDFRKFPYSPEFYGDTDPLNGYAYDRFWHSTGHHPAQSDFHATRWLCSGYSFTAVGDAGSSFFTDDRAGALAHFNHHYFALMMIALFHRASLLRYKHQLSEYAEALVEECGSHEDREEKFRIRSTMLQKELLRFRSIYWFSEVSNQIQGQELFSMFRRHLNLNALYEDVCQDSENAASVLQGIAEERRAVASERRAVADERRAAASERLSMLGFLFVVLAPLVDLIKDDLLLLPAGRQALGMTGLMGMVFAIAAVPFSQTGTEAFRRVRKWLFGGESTTERIRVSPGAVAGFVVIQTASAALLWWSLSRPVPARSDPAPRNDASIIEGGELSSVNALESQDVAGPSETASEPSDSDSQASSNSSGLNESSDERAPQNPKSGKEPPNQDAGADGDASASRSTSQPSPKNADSDEPVTSRF